MGTRNDPGTYDCMAKAEPDEPVFVLLGRDPAAPLVVVEWARRRLLLVADGRKPETDLDQVAEALDLVRAMLEWRRRHRGGRSSIPGDALAAQLRHLAASLRGLVAFGDAPA